MPLPGGDRKTLWIMGIFLLFSVLLVTVTEVVLPAAVMYPALYCFYADRMPFRWPVLLACAPLALSVVPGFAFGAAVYAVLLVCTLAMYLFLRRGKIGLTVAAPAILMSVLIMASIFSAAYHGGVQVSDLLARWAAEVVGEMGRISDSAMSNTELLEFKERLPMIQERIVMLFPSILLTGAVFIFWLNLLIIARRYQDISLREWKSPDWFISFFIIACLLTLVQQKQFHALGLNLLVVVGQVYFLQGMAIVSVFMAEYRWSAMLRWPIYILILIQIYIMIIVAGFGLFDTWFDFRKRIRTPKGDRE